MAFPGDESINLKEQLLVNPDPDGVTGLTSGGFFRKYGSWREKPAESTPLQEYLGTQEKKPARVKGLTKIIIPEIPPLQHSQSNLPLKPIQQQAGPPQQLSQ